MANYRVKYDRDAIYAFIIEYKRANDGNSPTIREICKEFSIPSTNTVAYILSGFARQGKIKLVNSGNGRCIHVVGGQWSLDGQEGLANQ